MRTAIRWVWEAAGMIDNVWGRWRVIAAFAGAVSAIFFVAWSAVSERFDPVGIIALALATFFGLICVVLVAGAALQRRAADKQHETLPRPGTPEFAAAQQEMSQLFAGTMELTVGAHKNYVGEAAAPLQLKSDGTPFPDIRLELIKFTWREEGKNFVITLPLNVTNRGDIAVNLQFELGFEREHLHRMEWVKRYAQEGMPMSVMQHNVLPPLHVEAKHTDRVELIYWIGANLLEHLVTESVVFERTYRNLHPTAFRLRVSDYVSGTSQERPLALGEVPCLTVV